VKINFQGAPTCSRAASPAATPAGAWGDENPVPLKFTPGGEVIGSFHFRLPRLGLHTRNDELHENAA
jgi:hypothetical protein